MSSSPRPRPASLLWSMPGPGASTVWPWGARSTESREKVPPQLRAHLNSVAEVNGERLPTTCPNQGEQGNLRKLGQTEGR